MLVTSPFSIHTAKHTRHVQRGAAGVGTRPVPGADLPGGTMTPTQARVNHDAIDADLVIRQGQR